ncbi:MAG: hypothetical protein WCI77_05825 [Candidatus Omnitrophota bacterium]
MAPLALCRNKIRILNFDDSILKQRNLLRDFSVPPFLTKIVDCTSEAPYLRYWADRKGLERLQHKLSPQERNITTLYGSGDFHHISIALLAQFAQPISLVVFDHHPDWDGLPPQLSCGSWVNTVAARENVKKVILLGPSCEDLSTRGLLTASFCGLRNRKVEIFPYSRPPAKVFLRPLDGVSCLNTKKGYFCSTIQWQNLAEKSIESFLEELAARIPTDDIYISIDKDCLTRAHAVTNWEEGSIPLDWLLAAIGILKSKKNVAGMDITGEYSSIYLRSLVKRVISFFDHPKNTFLAQDLERINALNEITNLKILQSVLAS